MRKMLPIGNIAVLGLLAVLAPAAPAEERKPEEALSAIVGVQVPLKVLQGMEIRDVTVRSIDRVEYFKPARTY